MSTLQVERMELRAMEQRARLHKTADELKTKVAATRERFDISRNVREHLIGASLAVSLLGFVTGYGLAGIFTDS